MRRKIVRKTKPSTAQDDKKLQGALKKLNVQPIPGVEEVNMFREDGNVLHFSTPKGTSRVRSRDHQHILARIVWRVHRASTRSCTARWHLRNPPFAYMCAPLWRTN